MAAGNARFTNSYDKIRLYMGLPGARLLPDDGLQKILRLVYHRVAAGCDVLAGGYNFNIWNATNPDKLPTIWIAVPFRADAGAATTRKRYP